MSDCYVVTDGGVQTHEEIGQLSTRKLSRFLELFEDCGVFVCLFVLALGRITVYGPVAANEIYCPIQRICLFKT